MGSVNVPREYFSIDRLLQVLSRDSEMLYALKRDYTTMFLDPLIALHSWFQGHRLEYSKLYTLYGGRDRPSQRVGMVLHRRRSLDINEKESGGVEELLAIKTNVTLALSTGLLPAGGRVFTMRADSWRGLLVSEEGPEHKALPLHAIISEGCAYDSGKSNVKSNI